MGGEDPIDPFFSKSFNPTPIMAVDKNIRNL
jgi:hypothetical protein